MKKRHSRFGGLEMEHMGVRATLLDLVLDIPRDDHLDWPALVHMVHALDDMLSDPQRLAEWGQTAQRRVHDSFLILRQLHACSGLFMELV